MRYLTLTIPFLLFSCYKKSDDVCPTSPVDRLTNITYQAHWPATVTVASNWSDTVYFYWVEPVQELDYVLTGETKSYYFIQYQDYHIYVDVEDSLQSAVDSAVSVTVAYECP